MNKLIIVFCAHLFLLNGCTLLSNQNTNDLTAAPTESKFINIDASEGYEIIEGESGTPNNPTPISSDAFQISFLSDSEGPGLFPTKDLYIVDQAGSITRLTEGFDIFFYHWSPDGNKIAFIAFVPPDLKLYVMNFDGSDVYELPFDPGITDLSFDWSPDNTGIVISMERDENSDLFTINVDSQEISQLTHTTKIDELYPQWSPNGDQIVYTSDYDGREDLDIFIMDADGSNVQQLTDSLQIESLPKWSPNGNQIAFQRYEPQNYQIWVMDNDGNNQKFLVDTYTSDYYFPKTYFWSPDGNKIAFSPSPHKSINVIDVTTGEEISIRNQFEYVRHSTMRWHPDGKRIVFSGSIDWNDDIYIVNIETNEINQITVHEEDDFNPEWRP